MVNFTTPKDLRGKWRLFVNGVEYELTPEVASSGAGGTCANYEVGVPTEPKNASRRATIEAALPDFERVVEETGILKPKP
jgi:hypothetical protein